MAKITLAGVDALTESGGVVTIPAAANLNLGAGAVPTAAIQDDAVTSAKLDTNIAVGGTLGVTGVTTLTGAATLSSTLAVTGTSTLTGNVTAPGKLIVTGDLTVNGTTVTLDAATLVVDDKNIEMGSVASPTDATADGGGITLKGTTDKTILWENDTDSWNFNQNIETTTTTKVKQKGAFMQSSTHQVMVLGG